MTLRTFSEIAGAVVGRVGKRKSYADGTGDPVRALSYDVDDKRANPWVRLGDGSLKQMHVWRDSLLLTLKELRQKQRDEGFRGWNRLQANDLLIYEALLARMDAATGKLYPELKMIAADAGLSKQTVTAPAPAVLGRVAIDRPSGDLHSEHHHRRGKPLVGR